MATYFIGDVHGCLQELKELMHVINFEENKDKLIFVGDLINRGSESIGVLRFVRSLGDSAEMVLGNHDVSLIAYAAGVYHGRGTDFPEIMQANDVGELLEWLRKQPILIYDETLNVLVTHAGIPPRWTIEKAIKQAKKVEKKLRGEKFQNFLRFAYLGEKLHRDKGYDKYDKFKYRLDAFTRMRYCTLDGEPYYKDKSPIGTQKENLHPWFTLREKRVLDADTKLIFGHWAALGLHESKNAICLDSGCAWGGALTAATLESGEIKYYQNR